MAKYTQKDRDAMAAKGQAMPDGSYPIADKQDLQNAIHAVGRGGADHDAIRRHIIKRAKSLGAADMIPDNWNADGSLKNQNSANALALRADLCGVRETRNTSLAGFDLREQPDGTGTNRLMFTGYACVTESPYKVTDALGEYQETVSRQAFDKTLADGADVSFLVNHEGVAMARTRSGSLRLASDTRGLHVEARLNPGRPDVQIARAAIDDGELNEMSFAFKALRQKWDDDYTDRRLDEVSLHRGDVSIVNFGANPATAGSVMLRSQAAQIRGFDTDRMVAMLREIRSGASLSDAAQSTLRSLLSLAMTDDGEIHGVISEFLETSAQPEVRKGLDLDTARARLYALQLSSA